MTLRVRIDMTRCEGNGICSIVAGGLFRLDAWGFPYALEATVESPRDVRRALRGARACPRRAIVVEPVPDDREVLAGLDVPRRVPTLDQPLSLSEAAAARPK